MATRDPDLAAYSEGATFRTPILFLYGSDESLVASAVTDLAKKIRDARPDLETPERLAAPAMRSDAAQLYDFFDEQPLLGGARFLIITDLTERDGKTVMAAFERDAPSPGPMVLFATHGLRARSKIIDAARRCPFCDLISVYEAPLTKQAAASILDAARLQPASDDALTLAHRLLSTLDPASRHQFIEQIALYCTGAQFEADDLVACFPEARDHDPSSILDAILSGGESDLIAWRRAGAAEGSDPIQQLAMTARALTDARRALSPVGPPVFWKVDKTVKAAARRLSHFDIALSEDSGQP
ncbi:MAG: hypothetical protein AAGM38_17200 [Pseudomonadota bacterium]